MANNEAIVVSEVHEAGNSVINNEIQLSIFPLQVEDTRVSISIKHHIVSSIENVGLQLWMGAFVLSDYIIHNRRIFRNREIIELGAGMGLVSSVCASALVGCSCVIAMDLPFIGILDLLHQNISINNTSNAQIMVLPLDITDDACPLFHSIDDDPSTDNHPNASDKTCEFSWNLNHVEICHSCEIFFGADIIYKDDVTFALISRLYKLLFPQKILYLSLEKRIQFTLQDLEPRAPAFDFLLNTIDAFNLNYSELYPNSPLLHAEQIDISNLPQYFKYNRTKELELWTITLKKV